MIVKHSIRTSHFVINLVKILSEPKYSHIIAWEWSGTSFVIRDSTEFASKVLPQYYETTRLASFTRQLNNYGFERVSDRRRTKQSVVTSSIVYSHQYFKRDQPDSLYLIRRISGSYSKVRAEASDLGEGRDIKSTLLPSPLSSVLLSTPRGNSHSVSQDGSESLYTKDTVVDCLSCIALKCELAILRKTIEYYRSLILTNNQEACTVDISQPLVPSSSVPVSVEGTSSSLWISSDSNVYPHIYPYPSYMCNTEWFPNNGGN
ncbi:hypothetical protein K7432_018662 [Basidiobolus ranarum]|uniref:HSF-type DNA-binding domain-containing protein n=1 Tax=Basidiobolus ranarum TaxID=34480 RepID=A0ABR2WGH3_9FUNG